MGKRKVKISLILAYLGMLAAGCSSPVADSSPEVKELLKDYPTIGEFLVNATLEKKLKTDDDVALYRFRDSIADEPVYVAVSKTGNRKYISLPKGNYWVMDTAQVVVGKPFPEDSVPVFTTPVFILKAAKQSKVINDVYVEGSPFVPFPSDGDLWLSTWAGDGNIYSGWGDGRGPLNEKKPIKWVDCGVVKLTGDLPELQAEAQYREDETPPLEINDKPSSLLYLDSCLYGQFHSPLGDARIGYLSVSRDYGVTWNRLGYFGEKDSRPEGASPWLRENRSPFRCMFFINMGQNYSLNTDGYVYALGIGTEWHWMPLRVYLTRVRKENIQNYKSYEYFAGYSRGEKPQWSADQAKARPVQGPITFGQGSAIYHPGIKRYLFMTDFDVFDAPEPWGPWTYAGTWTNWYKRPGRTEWQGGYQPGILSKGTGPDYFWFTVSGQHSRPLVTYSYNLGKMILKLNQEK